MPALRPHNAGDDDEFLLGCQRFQSARVGQRKTNRRQPGLSEC
jgi:hypothetical protein